MSTPTTGRRIAVRQRRRPGRDAVAALAVILLAGALLLVTGLVQAEPDPAAEPTTTAVDHVATACLASPVAGAASAQTFAAPLPDPPGEAEEGSLTAGPVGSGTRPVTGAARGELQALEAPPRGGAAAVTATGAAAVGRGTFQVDQAQDGASLAAQECAAPRARWWFTGGGAGLDHTSELVMANLDPGPAVVDVTVHGPTGPVESLDTRGITIAPGEVHRIELVEIAPQTDELAVHVEASGGRVAAGLADDFATTPAAEPGHEWVPPQAEASRAVRLGPLPPRADRRTLVLANPGDREALVDVEVSGGSGSFAPADLAQVRVPPGAVVTADIGSAIGRDASAVLLSSPVPVTATVRSALGEDVSYAAAVPVLDGPAAAVLAQDAQASVVLTSGESGGTATVTAYSARGEEVDAEELKVQPTATVAWTPDSKASYVVVTPRGGQVFGGVSLAGDAGVSQVPFRALPVVLTRPAVEPVVR
jgi:hypothetical protein